MFWDTPFAECTATQHFDGPKNGPGFEYTYNPPKGWVDTKNEQPFVVSQHFWRMPIAMSLLFVESDGFFWLDPHIFAGSKKRSAKVAQNPRGVDHFPAIAIWARYHSVPLQTHCRPMPSLDGMFIIAYGVVWIPGFQRDLHMSHFKIPRFPISWYWLIGFPTMGYQNHFLYTR